MRGIKSKGKNKWKKIATFTALFLLLVVLTNSTRKVYNKKVEAGKLLLQMQQDVQTLEDREKFLNESLQKLQTKEGVAFEMRKKLNVAEAGESVAVIVDDNSQPTTTPAMPISGWQKFKDFWVELFR